MRILKAMKINFFRYLIILGCIFVTGCGSKDNDEIDINTVQTVTAPCSRVSILFNTAVT